MEKILDRYKRTYKLRLKRHEIAQAFKRENGSEASAEDIIVETSISIL